MSKAEKKLIRKILTRAYERMRQRRRTFPGNSFEHRYYTNGIAELQSMIAWTQDYARFR